MTYEEKTEIVKVGMADLNIVRSPGMITTLGLGSCVAVVLYDTKLKIAGMAHVMLPDSKVIKNNENIAKFADTALEELLNRMLKLGVEKRNLVAKIAGGAQMFAFDNADEIFSVGRKNIEACKEFLSNNKIQLIAEDTGKNYGRTVEFYTESGQFKIRTIGKGESYI